MTSKEPAAIPSLTEALTELFAAMQRYEADADGDKPVAHRHMMERAAAALNAPVPGPILSDERRKHDIAGRLSLWLSSSLDDHARQDEYRLHIRAWLDHQGACDDQRDAARFRAIDKRSRYIDKPGYMLNIGGDFPWATLGAYADRLLEQEPESGSFVAPVALPPAQGAVSERLNRAVDLLGEAATYVGGHSWSPSLLEEIERFLANSSQQPADQQAEGKS